jgi:two-component system, NarL family, response regulator LiaR
VIRVLIADDHEVVRQGLRFVLEQEPDLEVVGDCADGRQALAAVERLHPDVLLLDLVMPGLDGMGVLHALREGTDGQRGRGGQGGRGAPGGSVPTLAVIVLTSFPAEEQAMAAVRAGATSYLAKSTAVDLVVEAVRVAAAGGSTLDPLLVRQLVQQARDGGGGPLRRLSAREREVLAALSRGRSNREIARTLMMGEQTVKTHVSSILAKLGLQDRTQAAIFGLQQGLVPLGDALSEQDRP